MKRAPFACALRAWHEHQSELRGYLIHRASDPPLAEDLLQGLFIKAMREGEDFGRSTIRGAWLFQVARNALVDHLRLTKAAAPLPDDAVAAQEPIAPVDALAECLECVLPELSAADRDIVQRCDLDGVKLQAYADEHGLSLPAVKSRLQRARHRMRELLIEHCQVRFDDAGQVCCYLPRTAD